jgi:hypothetical protein
MRPGALSAAIVDRLPCGQAIIRLPLTSAAEEIVQGAAMQDLLQRLNGKQVRVRATPCLCCPRNGKRVWACRNATGQKPGKATGQDLRARIPAFAHHWTEVSRGSGHRTLGARACLCCSPSCSSAFLARRLAGTLVGNREKSIMHPIPARSRCRGTFTATVAALVSTALHAADTQLDPIVVTATRQATRTNELTSDVSVITREEIDQAGESTLAQLLARQPGIQYVANGGAGSNSGVFIRGANTNQSIVLIDGQRIGSATTGSAALSRIPLDQIERIEILRGPASSLYGADAIGGVIQIFTRRGEGPVRVNASTGYGSYHTTDTSVGIAGGTDLRFLQRPGRLYEHRRLQRHQQQEEPVLQPRPGWLLQQEPERQFCRSPGQRAGTRGQPAAQQRYQPVRRQ